MGRKEKENKRGDEEIIPALTEKGLAAWGADPS